MYSYRKLAVWRRAHALALHVHEVTERNYRGRYWSLIEEMRRTATSVPLLIADASREKANAQRLALLAIALETIGDLDYYVLLARDLGLITLSDHVRLDARMDQVVRTLGAIRERMGRNPQQTTLDSRFRGTDGGMDSRLRGTTEVSSPRKRGSSVVRLRSRQPSG